MSKLKIAVSGEHDIVAMLGEPNKCICHWQQT
jgi:hypothetical protein